MPTEVTFVHYLPLVTTALSIFFGTILFRHWQRTRTPYILWWMLGVVAYGLGTFAEGFTTLFGWQAPVFRLWYIAGALLGGAPLAQGTVYLLLRRRTANILATLLVAYVAVASTFVLLTPIDAAAVESNRLSGQVMEWSWVRLFSPFVNTYAVIFLVGGAILSAIRYWRRSNRPVGRVWGNVLIAVGAILPGIGGTYARLGKVEVLYVTELIGLTLIYLGYRMMAKLPSPSVHPNQQEAAATG